MGILKDVTLSEVTRTHSMCIATQCPKISPSGAGIKAYKCREQRGSPVIHPRSFIPFHPRSFIIGHSSPVIHPHSSSVIHPIHHRSFIIGHSSPVIHPRSFIPGHSSSVIHPRSFIPWSFILGHSSHSSSVIHAVVSDKIQLPFTRLLT